MIKSLRERDYFDSHSCSIDWSACLSKTLPSPLEALAFILCMYFYTHLVYFVADGDLWPKLQHLNIIHLIEYRLIVSVLHGFTFINLSLIASSIQWAGAEVCAMTFVKGKRSRWGSNTPKVKTNSRTALLKLSITKYINWWWLLVH